MNKSGTQHQCLITSKTSSSHNSNPLPADFLQLRAALRGNQEDTNRFFMAKQGMIPPEQFFNPQNLRRLMSRASAKA